MLLTKEKKKELIKEFESKLENSKSVVLADYRGLKVSQLQALRDKMFTAKIDLKVVKNKLFGLALKAKNISIEESILDKPLLAAFDSDDEVAPCKIINEFTKENESLQILGGVINKKFAALSEIKILANLASREEMYAKVVGSCAAPIRGFVNVLAGNLRGLMSVLRQYKESKN